MQKISTLAASQSNPLIYQAISGGGIGGNNNQRDVKLAEEYLKRRIGLRSTVSTKKFIEEAEMQEVYHGKLLRRLR